MWTAMWRTAGRAENSVALPKHTKKIIHAIKSKSSFLNPHFSSKKGGSYYLSNRIIVRINGYGICKELSTKVNTK